MHTGAKVRYIVHFVPSHRPNDTDNNVNYFIKAFYLNGDLNNDGFLILPVVQVLKITIQVVRLVRMIRVVNDYHLDDWFYD